MSETSVIERRLAEVERAVAELRERLGVTRSESWLARVIGSIRDPDAFDDALAVGRALRESDRPTSDPGEPR